MAPAAAAVAGVLGLIMPSSSAAGLPLTPNGASRREPAAASAQPAPPSAGLPVQHEMVHPPAEPKASGSHRAGPVATPPTTAPSHGEGTGPINGNEITREATSGRRVTYQTPASETPLDMIVMPGRLVIHEIPVGAGP